jgi:hypothetical protein
MLKIDVSSKILSFNFLLLPHVNILPKTQTCSSYYLARDIIRAQMLTMLGGVDGLCAKNGWANVYSIASYLYDKAGI